MANFGIGLAQGFQLGTQVGEALRKRRMREAFEEAQADKQFRKYTPEQGERMRREAAMVDEFGNPLYEFSIEPGSIEYTRRELRYPNARAAELPQMSLADQTEPEVPAPRSFGTRYRTPTGTMGLRGENFTPDTIGETDYDVDTRGFRNLSPQEAAKVYAHPKYDPNLSANAQYDMLFGPQPRRGLSVTGPEYSPALLPPEQSRVQQRLGREYGDSMMYSPEATQYLGQTYGAEGLTPTQQRAALMNRYADIISKYESPVEGERFRSMARAEDRAQEAFDLNKQLTQFNIKTAARTEKEAADLEAISTAASTYRAENPNASPLQIVDHVRKTVKVPDATLNKFIAGVAGVDETEMKLMKNEVTRIIDRTKGNLDSLINVYNSDERFDPSTNLVKSVDKNGKVTIKMVSAADPSRVLSSQTFNSESEAFGDLSKRATDPVNYAGWALDVKYKESQIAANEGLGALRRFKAEGGGLRPGRDYTQSDAASRARAMTGIRSELSRDAERLRDQLAEMPKNDPNREAVTKQLNDTLNDLRQVDAELRGYRTGGGGLSRSGGGGTTYKTGETYEFVDETGKPQRVKFKGGDSNDVKNWEPVTETAPAKAEPAKAEPAKIEEPKEDTKKYIRSKSPRGNWVYEESPRGLTKAQYAEIDKKK